MGPPIGGALYQKLGFHAPFIFCLGMTAVDFIGRLFVIEKKDAVKWTDGNTRKSTVDHSLSLNQDLPCNRSDEPADEKTDDAAKHTSPTVNRLQHEGSALPSDGEKTSQLRAICMLLRSPRAITALLTTFIFG